MKRRILFNKVKLPLLKVHKVTRRNNKNVTLSGDELPRGKGRTLLAFRLAEPVVLRLRGVISASQNRKLTLMFEFINRYVLVNQICSKGGGKPQKMNAKGKFSENNTWSFGLLLWLNTVEQKGEPLSG